MFKAIGNFFSAVFGTPSKTTVSVVNVPDKLEPPIVKLGPEKAETDDSKSVAAMKVEAKPKTPRAKKVVTNAVSSSVKKTVEKKDKPAKASTEKKPRTKKQQ